MGIDRTDAQRALAAGWSKSTLAYLNQEATAARAKCTFVDPFAFLVEDYFLVYRTTNLNSIKASFNREGCSHCTLQQTVAYTDGSGTTGDKPAGIGVALYEPGYEPLLIAQNIGLGTNNRAELCAIWAAMRACPEIQADFVIKSDSEYAIGALTNNWARNVNAELITNIRRDLALRPGLVFEHVDGHKGVAGNEIADLLSKAGRKYVTDVTHYEG